jgi:hypothetical protein
MNDAYWSWPKNNFTCLLLGLYSVYPFGINCQNEFPLKKVLPRTKFFEWFEANPVTRTNNSGIIFVTDPWTFRSEYYCTYLPTYLPKVWQTTDTNSPPTLTGAGHQWTIPTSKATFRVRLGSESHWLQPMLVLNVHWWPTLH